MNFLGNGDCEAMTREELLTRISEWFTLKEGQEPSGKELQESFTDVSCFEILFMHTGVFVSEISTQDYSNFIMLTNIDKEERCYTLIFRNEVNIYWESVDELLEFVNDAIKEANETRRLFKSELVPEKG